MSSGNAELLDYEPENEAPTAQQFPAAGAGDESGSTPSTFTVDDLLDNIATADPADLEQAYNAGRISLEDVAVAARLSSDSPLFVPPFPLPQEDALIHQPQEEFIAYQELTEMWCQGLARKIAEAEARELEEREDAERKEEREAALAAAARRQEEERKAALAAAARKQEEEREAALAAAARQAEKQEAARAAARKKEEQRLAELAEREVYVQAAWAKQGALRSRLDNLEQRPHGPQAAALPSPSSHRRVIVPPKSQVTLGSGSTTSTKGKGQEVAATPEFSVTLDRPAGGEDGASAAANATSYKFLANDPAFLSRPVETPARDITFHDADKMDALFAWAGFKQFVRAQFTNPHTVAFGHIYSDPYIEKLPPSPRQFVFRLLFALRRATFPKGPQGTSVVTHAGESQLPLARAASNMDFLDDLQPPPQQATPRPARVPGKDKDYSLSAAPASQNPRNRWGDQASTAKSGAIDCRRFDQSSRERGIGDGGRGQAGTQHTRSSPAGRHRRSRSRSAERHQRNALSSRRGRSRSGDRRGSNTPSSRRSRSRSQNRSGGNSRATSTDSGRGAKGGRKAGHGTGK